MIEIIWDNKFKRNYKKKIHNNETLKNKFNTTLQLFSQNPFEPRLRTHKLTGKLQDTWAFSVDYDLRVIFKFIQSNKILLIDIGSHEEIY